MALTACLCGKSQAALDGAANVAAIDPRRNRLASAAPPTIKVKAVDNSSTKDFGSSI
jgi:hypothetical protein